MKTLRQGDTGPEVGALQKKLIAAGHSTLKADGHFGIATDQALRAFQRQRGLLPDGIAGERTQAALDRRDDGTATALDDTLRGLVGAPVVLAALYARDHAPFVGGVALSPRTLKTSEKGKLFIYGMEAEEGKSDVLHWPGGDSGVTLGPGYDMKGRSEEKIIADLTAIGIAPEVAAKAAKGKGLTGKQAEAFVRANAGLIDPLRPEREFALLERVLPEYEQYVRDAVHVDLHQHEFDALVSFSWNIGEIPVTGGHINRGEVHRALEIIQGATKSKGKEMPGLVARRRREVALYLYAEYGPLPRIG